jgi:SWI/SNF-related matrix-associated actin-dependent regulator of chromatin subfamily A member 5
MSQACSRETPLLRSPENYAKIADQPKGIKGTMKKHQVEGLSFLVWLQANGINGILGDEMGLGKTIQTLSLLQHTKEHSQEHTQNPTNYKPSIVVCPLAVLETWQSQARTFAPSLSTLIFHAPITQRQTMRSKLRRAMNSKSVDIVVVSYETYERELLALRLYKWSHAVLDEGHKMKNADSQIAKALQTIAADHRLILTG